MALLVCCPCGNPLDCDQLDLVVTLTCPRCERELTLETEDARGRRAFAALTVMEGPYWIGERFIMPVGEQLVIGKGAANWLSLDSDGLSEAHCTLRVHPNGRIDVEALSKAEGVWIEDACVVRGRLRPEQSLRIGEYRFRLDFLDAIGGERVVDDETPLGDSSFLPTMVEVGTHKTPADWLVRSRFQVSRWMILSFAWLTAITHTCVLRAQPEPDRWPWYWALTAGLVILVALVTSGRRVTLAHRYLRYVSLGLLVLLAGVDMVQGMAVEAIAALVLSSALVLIQVASRRQTPAIVAGLLGVSSLTMMAVQAVRAVLAVVDL
ncbi:MAG: FHA domain-containing protein [Phycisphaerae bacterium]